MEEGLRLSEVVEQHGWEVTKDDFPESRRILQALGSDAGWMLHGTRLWVDPVDRAFHGLPAGDPVVVTDIRYDFEADWVREQGGVVVRILRPGQDGLDAGMSAHSSEVADFEVDLELLNDSSVEELHAYMCRELPALIPTLLSRRG